VPESPSCYLPALPPRRQVGEAKVDAFVDSRINHILGRILEVAVRARLLDGYWVGCSHREDHFVRPEEERQHTGHRTGDAVCARGVIRVIGRVDERLPLGVA
jgi:hypothetical protein